jgi:hypothetical protein
MLIVLNLSGKRQKGRRKDMKSGGVNVTMLDKMREDKTRYGWTRQDKTRQDKIR